MASRHPQHDYIELLTGSLDAILGSYRNPRVCQRRNQRAAFVARKRLSPPSSMQGREGVSRSTPDCSNRPIAQRQLGIIYLDQGELPQAYPLLKKAVN